MTDGPLRGRSSPDVVIAMIAGLPDEQRSRPLVRYRLFEAYAAKRDVANAVALASALLGAPGLAPERRAALLRFLLNHLVDESRLDAFFSTYDDHRDEIERIADTTLRRDIARAIGKADLRRGCLDAAEATFTTMLAEDPRDAFSFELLADCLVKRGETERLFRLADAYRARGILNAAVLMYYVNAGLEQDAPSASDLARKTLESVRVVNLIEQGVIRAGDVEAIARLIREASDRYFIPRGTSDRRTLRLQPLGERIEGLLRPVADHIDRLIAAEAADPDSVFALNPPADRRTLSWANIYRAGGYQSAHCHHRSWASTVFYVGELGVGSEVGRRFETLNIGFYPASQDAGRRRPTRSIAPEPGMLVVLPSHLPHWTDPCEQDDRRYSIVIDIQNDRHADVGGSA